MNQKINTIKNKKKLELMFLRPLDCFQIVAFLDHFPERGHGTETVDMVDNKVGRKIDFVYSGETAKTESNRSVGHVFFDTECAENVRRFERCRSTSTARG